MTRTTFFSALLLSSFVVAACGETAGPNDETGDDDITSGAALQVYVRISESKLVFSSQVESFGVKGGALDLPCRTDAWYLDSKPTLYREAGWAPEKAADFSEDVDGASLHEYVLASCRNADTNVVAWFGKEREYELTIPDQFLEDDYKASQLPLILQKAKLGGGDAPTYYSCDGAFSKKLIGETANAKRYDLSVKCKKRAAPSKGELGPIDFIDAPGPYAAVASYKPWMLPPVASTKQNFDKAKAALLARVPEAKYAGAMSTLGKTCGLEVKATADALVIEHTIDSSGRKRTVTLTPDTLLGFVEGDMFADPIRVKGDATGSFAAAEIAGDKGDTTVIRFEKNTTLDGLVVRIDGAEAYCRRLTR